MIQQATNITEISQKCFIAEGSNQAFEDIQPFKLVDQTLAHIQKLGGGNFVRITGVSRWYRSPAFPSGSGPDYINGVIAAETRLPARDLLDGLHSIEQRFGRARTNRWAARTLDLDLIDYAGRVHPDLDGYRNWADATPQKQQSEAPDGLILPHPRLQDRGFVLLPLRDVSPAWCHPVSGATVDQLIDNLPDAALAGLEVVEPAKSP